jgi:hypothetical protein
MWSAFVEVAAMEVDKVIAAVDNFLGDEEGGTLGLRAIFLARIKAVHAFLVDRVDVRNFLLERGEIDERKDDDGTGELGWIEIKDERFEGDDGSIFGAMRTGDESQNRAGLDSVDDDDRDICGRIDARGNFE